MANNAAFDFLAPPVPQTGSSKIVFASNREGSMQIYVMNGDGSGVTRMTFSDANDDYPRWSPNGTKILLQSDRNNPFSGIYDIYVMNADGSGVTQLTSDANDDSMASWSPDGTKVVFQSLSNGMKYQVYSMNADGSNKVNLSNSLANDGEPSWSPDGNRIAFTSDRDHEGFKSIYVMNSDGSGQQRLTFSSGDVHDGQPVWSTDGNRIAFVSTRDSTSETWQETDDFKIPEDDGQLISKSRLLVNKEIYVMNADGSGQTRLTNEPGNDDSPSWSPDGAKIIFYSDRERDGSDPISQVWFMNADGTNQINVSNSSSGDYSASLTSHFTNNTSQLASEYSGGNQPPVANAGGSYIGQLGQPVQLNGGGSFDPDGTIVSYSWNLGDGTSATGAVVNHQYAASGVYPVSLSVLDNSGNTTSAQGFVTVDAVALPVKVTFDELPDNTVVADQYSNQYGVRFSSGNFFFPVHTYRNCGLTCGPVSFPNFISTKPDDTGQLIVTFAQPVNNLVFYAIGVDTLSGTFAFVDLYRNGSVTPSNTFAMNGIFSRTVGFTSGSLNNIDKVVIRGIIDPAGIGFDDFSFTLPADVKITSGRVSGYLNGTNQNALLGADVSLNATPQPGVFAGGTYSWSCTPAQLCSILTASNSSSVTLRTNDVGTITATVSYTKNGLTASGSVTINSVLPTLTSFTAQQADDRVNAPGQCSGHFGAQSLLWFYDLGCEPSVLGISFLALARPPTTLLSDPSMSGLKFVQAISTFRKRHAMGLRCDTRRTSESDAASGWQLDTSDPFKTELGAVRYFSQMLPFTSDLSIVTDDFPGSALTRFEDYGFVDAMYIDDGFEMYVVYFAGGGDPGNPFIQRPIGKLAWNWGGLVVFDANGHHRRYSNAAPGPRTGQATSTMVAMQGNVASNSDVPCPGGPPLSRNKLDNSRYFVRQHYLDFLGREPDASGWDFWTIQISQCAFDQNCIRAERIHIGLAFFFSGEFIQTDPDLANPPGTPGFNPSVYNRAFVKHCYLRYLRRDPDVPGWNYWTDALNSDGNYAHIIDAFQVCDDYRNRPGFNLP